MMGVIEAMFGESWKDVRKIWVEDNFGSLVPGCLFLLGVFGNILRWRFVKDEVQVPRLQLELRQTSVVNTGVEVGTVQ
jgi:hypothetical protein